MTDFEAELAELRAEVVRPDAEATLRVSTRLSQSIGALAMGGVSAARPTFRWAEPLRLVTGFVIGGVVGALLYGALRPPRVERVYIERSIASAQPPRASVLPEAEPSLPPPLPSSNMAAPEQTRSAPTASVSVGHMASLAEQQALLDVARATFARGDYAQTLKTLTAHAARFPRSLLVEEREALQIKALAASDRLPEARARALRFKARYPQSLLLPSINDSVGAIP